MENEAQMTLVVKATSWQVQEYGLKLWKKASVVPYMLQKCDENYSDEFSETRVMFRCQGSAKDPTTFVMLDSSIEVLDTLFTSHSNICLKNPVQIRRK